MNRTEDNHETMKVIREIKEKNGRMGMLETAITELCFIEAYLADISRSLAIIADKVKEGEAE